MKALVLADAITQRDFIGTATGFPTNPTTVHEAAHPLLGMT